MNFPTDFGMQISSSEFRFAQPPRKKRKRSLAFDSNDSRHCRHTVRASVRFEFRLSVRSPASQLSLNGNFLTRFHAPKRTQTEGRPTRAAADQSQAPIHVGASDVD